MDPDDTLLQHYLSASWAKICQAMGPEFEPYLPVVMPPLLQSAAVKADVSIFGEWTCSHIGLDPHRTLGLTWQILMTRQG